MLITLALAFAVPVTYQFDLSVWGDECEIAPDALTMQMTWDPEMPASRTETYVYFDDYVTGFNFMLDGLAATGPQSSIALCTACTWGDDADAASFSADIFTDQGGVELRMWASDGSLFSDGALPESLNLTNFDMYKGVTVDDGGCIVNAGIDGLSNITDGDLDGVLDTEDNCPGTANPDQADADGDGIGTACDDSEPVDDTGETGDTAEDTSGNDTGDTDSGGENSGENGGTDSDSLNDDVDAKQGCGCATPASPALAGLFALAVLTTRRRA